MKYFIYVRKSTDEDDRQVLSLEAQLTELREYAKKENLEIIEEFIESKTAKVPGRPIFNKMIEKIELGGPWGILAWHPDRLARNSVDGGKIIYLVDTGKIGSLKFPTFWFDSTPQGKFMLNIAFGQSKYYVDNLSENIKRGIRQKLRRGEMPGRAPIGYLNDPRQRNIVKDPERWEKVKQLFESYATGKYTLLGTQKLSLSLGLVSRGKGKPLAVSFFKELLKNPFYYGVFRLKGELYQGIHEPIISKQLFDKVQEVLKAKGKPRKSKEQKYFAFRGIFACGECGRMVTAEKHVKPSGLAYTYYRCTKKNTVCHQKYIEEKELVQQLNAIIQKVALPTEWKDKFLTRLDKEDKNLTIKSDTSAQNLQKEIAQLEERQSRLLDIYLDKQISGEEYASAKEKIINRIIELKEKIGDFGRKGNNWLELFREWILSAHQAQSVSLTDNLQEKRDFILKIGSNFRLVGREALIRLGEPWAAAAEKPASETWWALLGSNQ